MLSGWTAALPAGCSGSENQKVLPAPSLLSMPISPPISSTSRWQMARPSPVPPRPRSSWVKRWNRSRCRSAAMPIPVSVTVKVQMRLAPGRPPDLLPPKLLPSSSTALTDSRTEPRSVNFTALPSRFSRIWRSRSGSPMTKPRAVAEMVVWISSPFCSAASRTMATQRSARSSSRNGTLTRSSRPASSFDRSSTSLMTVSSERPASRTCEA